MTLTTELQEMGVTQFNFMMAGPSEVILMINSDDVGKLRAGFTAFTAK